MYDEEIEKAVLFYIIFKQADVMIEEADFVNDRNKKIVKAIIELKNKKQEISMLAIQSSIQANKKQVLEYISNLGNNIFGVNLDTCYRQLKELSKKRKVFDLMQKSIAELDIQEDMSIYTQQIVDELNKITGEEEKEKTFMEQIADTTEEIENNWKNRNDYSLYTGILDLDSKICGLHKKELTIIGARPGMGKTTLTLQIAQRIASKDKYVLFVSLEMSETQLIQKMIAKEGNINSYRMRMGTLEDEDWNKIADSSIKLSQLKFSINTKIRDVQKLEFEARRLKNKGKLDLLIIDYIQLLKSKDKFNCREQEVADISRRLKLLSLELDIPIIALCQLNRNANTGEPTLADLRESGSLEQDADNIIFIYRENEDDNITTLKLAKQRAGDTGKAKVKFNKATSTFIDLQRGV